MISKRELIDKISDPMIFDEEILEAVNNYCADRYDRSGKIISPTQDDINSFEEISNLIYRIRPRVMEMLNQQIVEQHKDCCPKDP